LDPDVFQEIDFLPSSATDRPIERSEIKVNLDKTLQSIYPLPKAPPRKNTCQERKATILTDDAAIEIIAKEEAMKQIHQLKKKTNKQTNEIKKY